jgi:hypothetical protein
MLPPMRDSRRLCRSVLLTAAVAAAAAGCSGAGTNSGVKETMLVVGESATKVDNALRPGGKTSPEAQLSKQTNATLGPAARPFNEEHVARAIQSYASSKGKTAGSYIVAGAQLNSAGAPEAVVYFTSTDWCQPQGCPLVVFQSTSFGYRHVSTINRVRPPILVGTQSSGGWKDLWVSTGKDATTKGKNFMNVARLQFGGNGYPNAATFAIAPAEAKPDGAVLIEAVPLTLPEKAPRQKNASDPFGRKPVKDKDKKKPPAQTQ